MTRASTLPMILGPGFVAALLLILEIACRSGAISPYMVPAPSAVALTLVELVRGGGLLSPLAHTLMLLLSGFLLACVTGIGLGVLMGLSRRAYNLFEPLVEVLRPIPKPALLPPLMLFLGFGAEMKIVVIWLSSLFPILINTIEGVRNTDPVLIETARTFHVGRTRRIFRIILPAAAPMILTGAKVGLGLALVLAVLAEMLASSGGLGAEIIDAQRAFRLPEMYAYIVVVSIVGIAQTAILRLLERKLAFWA
ncbi:ABC transporter permease [Palleronia sp. LCG004]|uniref:ABC transporter permease n=1 Tax=Palleronia sp. LCG004 TaxID=3079304 RepID=UPI00294270E8|nr:ABC transporter permease [Palleronia sp. LCG004]WOI57867.1 ABC transporter permease [Palleronia sp. LCG004]